MLPIGQFRNVVFGGNEDDSRTGNEVWFDLFMRRESVKEKG